LGAKFTDIMRKVVKKIKGERKGRGLFSFLIGSQEKNGREKGEKQPNGEARNM